MDRCGVTLARACATLVAVGAAVLGPLAPAYADSTVTVQGTSFPDPARAQLSFVGCSGLFQRTDETLRPMVGRGPGVAPAGERSVGFDLAGGSAVGSLYVVGSMLATTTASLSVNAPQGATGVAYAGYQAPADAGTQLLWLGRAALATPGGAWQQVDATTRSYVWTKYDMSSHQPVLKGPAAPLTVRDFAARKGGDGAGFYTIGFGCDGAPFSLDAMRVGAPGAVTTYDIEGLRTTVTIRAAHQAISRGDSVEIGGALHTGTGDAVPNATMILEQRPAGSEKWTPVRVASLRGGVGSVVVSPTTSTFYRWRFVDRPLAEGSVSPAFEIDVAPLVPSTDPTSDPTSDPSSSADPTPSDPSNAPTPSSPESTGSSGSDSSDSPSDSPSAQSAPEPSETADPTPSESASESASESSPAAPGGSESGPSDPRTSRLVS